jgi:hypothetical protein
MAEQQNPSQPAIGRQAPAAQSAPAAPKIDGQPLTMAQLPATTAAPVAAAGNYKDGKLTRSGMEHVIRSGGSVLHDGTVYTKLDTLPSEADLAKGDADAENAARENLLRQREALDQQLASLGATKAPAAPKK